MTSSLDLDKYLDKFDKTKFSNLLGLYFSDFDDLTLDNFITKFYRYTSEISPNIFEDKSNYNEKYFSFFKYSLFIYALKNSLDITYGSRTFNNKSTLIFNNDGLLKKTSGNCLHTVFIFKDNYGVSHKKFLKLVPYTEKPVEDCILLDIINGYIFNYIISKLERDSLISDFSKFIGIYNYSFLSYFNIKDTYSNKYWDYNKLIFNKSDIDSTSPYNPKDSNKTNFNNLVSTVHCLNNCYTKTYVYIGEAIDHISIYDLFFIDTEEIDSTLKMSILTDKFKNFFEFILYIGIKYGFHHSDLHSGNLVYNKDKNELSLIDFGRSVFAKFIIHNDDVINNYLVCEIEKLNLKFNDKYGPILSDIESYGQLFDYQNKKGLFHNSGYIESSTVGSVVIYPMIIFDLIQLCLSIYLCLTTVLNPRDMFFTHFNKIIKLEYPSDINSNFIINNKDDSLEKLFNNYIEIYSFINSISSSNKFKYTYKILLDGFLLLGLEAKFFLAIDDSNKIIHRNLSFNGILKDKKNFIEWLDRIYHIYNNDLFKKYNHFLFNIYENNIKYNYFSITRGGLSNFSLITKSNNIMKSPKLSISEKTVKSKISKEEEIEKLNNMYYNTYLIKNNKFKVISDNVEITGYNIKGDDIELPTDIRELSYKTLITYNPDINENYTSNYEELEELIKKSNLEEEYIYGGKNKKLRKLKKYNL
jgi:hypothetical protein